MNEQEKQLLLQDLCARLSCELKVEVDDYDLLGSHTLKGYEFGWFVVEGRHYDIDEVKPYLRPMDSMTEEELKCFQAFHCVDGLHPHFFQQMCNLDNETAMFNWLNKNMFDYRGLISKGLALEAPEGMYIIK